MLLELQEPFKSVWRKGYLREDNVGRRRVDLFNSNSDRTTISYARYLLSVKEGKVLSEEYEVDHIDGNCTNDSLNNLQKLLREDHRAKTVAGRPKRKFKILTCPVCKRNFKKWENQIRAASPKCSRRCNGMLTRNLKHQR